MLKHIIKLFLKFIPNGETEIYFCVNLVFCNLTLFANGNKKRTIRFC